MVACRLVATWSVVGAGSAVHVREASIVDAVRSAWKASLPSVPFELNKSWSDIGVDSLKALEFVFQLERALGARVGFDAMAPESTAADLVHLLAHGPDAPGSFAQARPRVFLVPGIFGDEPRLAGFRRALNREVMFETLELPDLDAPARLLGNVAATAAKLVKEVARLQPEGNILLAGFSFGSLVAQDMARQLEAIGRCVAFLALLDGLLRPGALLVDDRTEASARARDSSPASLPALSQDASNDERSGGWGSFLDRAIFSILLRLNAWEAARRFLVVAARRHDRVWMNKRRRWLIERLRCWAVLRWRPGVSSAATLLVTSTDFAACASVEAWRAICPQLRVAAVNTGHFRIFEPAPMATIAPAFLELLGVAAVRLRASA
jgi:thioesterase domain-containing protein/acyl carrier protein